MGIFNDGQYQDVLVKYLGGEVLLRFEGGVQVGDLFRIDGMYRRVINRIWKNKEDTTMVLTVETEDV